MYKYTIKEMTKNIIKGKILPNKFKNISNNKKGIKE